MVAIWKKLKRRIKIWWIRQRIRTLDLDNLHGLVNFKDYAIERRELVEKLNKLEQDGKD